ncbi:immunity 8 family protein [Proteus alimentorum]|uniref:immunity 8 family protein n=1 Tax=Proteus alimentorum TaxID=1973495 RepID=UPI000BFF94A3|nr:immunity 8 family protein [Proteus alimentorum]
MKAILKGLSNDFYDVDSYYPDDDKCFSLSLLLSIGSEDSNGADNFDLFVCSPEWISKNVWEPRIFRHTLITRAYNINEIKKIIESHIAKCDGNSWLEVAEKLSRYFAWEYEDYQS